MGVLNNNDELEKENSRNIRGMLHKLRVTYPKFGDPLGLGRVGELLEDSHLLTSLH